MCTYAFYFLSPSPSPSFSLLPSLSRGYIYHTVNIDTGWLVQCNGLLLYRKKSFDEGNSTNYCVRLNEKLEVNKICTLILHTSCLVLHVSYFMSHTPYCHTSLPHALYMYIHVLSYFKLSNIQSFIPGDRDPVL